MSQCRFCHHDNPTGIDRCQSCGAWIEQAVPPPREARESEPVPEEPVLPRPDGLEGEVLALMEQGRKIPAIKLYREQTGVGLKEAKDTVEALAAKYGIQPRGAGCATAVLLILCASTISGAVAWLLPG